MERLGAVRSGMTIHSCRFARIGCRTTQNGYEDDGRGRRERSVALASGPKPDIHNPCEGLITARRLAQCG
jgi:hypothetical protein